MSELPVIRCATCGVAVSSPLAELTDIEQLRQDDGSPLVPIGYFIISDGSYYTGSADHLVANLEDMRNTKQHTDLRRLNGCCGLDGCDGMNTLCINGHEIGTQRSDCWMAHGIHFDPTQVILTTET